MQGPEICTFKVASISRMNHVFFLGPDICRHRLLSTLMALGFLEKLGVGKEVAHLWWSFRFACIIEFNQHVIAN